MRKEDTNVQVVASVVGELSLSKMAVTAITETSFTKLVEACGYVQVIPGAPAPYMALYHDTREYTFGSLALMPKEAQRELVFIQTNAFNKDYLLKEIYDALVEKLADTYGLSVKESK